MALLLAGLLLSGLAIFTAARSEQYGGAPSRGTASCLPCHLDIVESFKGTAHFNASRPARGDSILGSFDEGRNVLRTQANGVYFRMERREDGFYQTGYERGVARTERFDLVIGSGRRGQSYLYWKGHLLLQLPVSYLAATGAWVNSPGYPDGTVHFNRLIPPRCLECHTSYFRFEGTLPEGHYARDYVLGIVCQRCHGEGVTHAEIRNPAHLTREQGVDACALCHSGMRASRKPLYGFRPGDNIDEYLARETEGAPARPDVHGNQVALLRASRCFAASPDMSCSTCHNVHRVQRDLAELSARCLRCHEATACKLAPTVGRRITDNCIDCHMPSQRSHSIAINTPGKPFFQTYRTHVIGIYPEASRTVLKSIALKKD
jgi:hypothetical protein